MMDTFCKVYRGHPVLDGNRTSPSGAMSMGVGVKLNGDTYALADVGTIPYAFLNNEVTVAGQDYEDMVHIPMDVNHVRKAQEGKVQLIRYQPGITYVIKGNVLSGVEFAAGEYVVMAANGEFSDENGASATNLRIGIVSAIGVTFAGKEDCIVWEAFADLGEKAGE